MAVGKPSQKHLTGCMRAQSYASGCIGEQEESSESFKLLKVFLY